MELTIILMKRILDSHSFIKFKERGKKCATWMNLPVILCNISCIVPCIVELVIRIIRGETDERVHSVY